MEPIIRIYWYWRLGLRRWSRTKTFWIWFYLSDRESIYSLIIIRKNRGCSITLIFTISAWFWRILLTLDFCWNVLGSSRDSIRFFSRCFSEHPMSFRLFPGTKISSFFGTYLSSKTADKLLSNSLIPRVNRALRNTWGFYWILDYPIFTKTIFLHKISIRKNSIKIINFCLNSKNDIFTLKWVNNRVTILNRLPNSNLSLASRECRLIMPRLRLRESRKKGTNSELNRET